MTTSRLLLPALLLVLALPLAACGEERAVGAADPNRPADSTAAGDDRPSHVPAAPGRVRSRTLVMVMDTGDGPELCLGAVAESYPPQCGGPRVRGWDWREHPVSERQGRVRWGLFAVTGTWDGEQLAVREAVPAALHDPMVPAPVELPEPSVRLDDEELQAVADALVTALPGALAAEVDRHGHVLVDVVYDDGSLQAAVDAEHGPGVVVVTGALLDA